ncbi:MAG: TIGR04283 family arsenosugar biosynthesis glycosyltransferase [Rhodospirillaceae bacterium]|nr:TIGR04283 family arsenosugar biosynthesis glycosyltransferase [Rhodospirillaceae bacterium]
MSESPAIDLSVVIPTLNASAHLPASLVALTAWPLASQIIVADGGSEDETVSIARDAGVTVVQSNRGRGQQLAHGAASAAGQWILFLHADTVLQNSWVEEVRSFVYDANNRDRAAAFRFALDDTAGQARRVERMVAWRCRLLGLPYGDQGLLIHRDLYNKVGGYQKIPLMEDADLVRRIGKRQIHIFDSAAVTSADRFRRGGWWARPLRNLFCLFLYICGVPPRWIAKLYG